MYINGKQYYNSCVKFIKYILYSYQLKQEII